MKQNKATKKDADNNQRNDELIEVKKPELPEVWDYKTSVKSMKRILHSWTNITEKMIRELSIARETLSSQGKRTDIRTNVPRFPTWEQYCNDVGISKRHANRLVDRYIAKKIPNIQITLPEKYTQVEKVEEKTEETEEAEKPETEAEVKPVVAQIKSYIQYENKIEDEDRNIIEIVCPKCKCKILYDVEKGVIVE